MSYFTDGDSVYFCNEGDGGITFYTSHKDAEQAQAQCNYLNGGDGLTKRERFAMAAMQGIQAQNFISEHNEMGMSSEDIANIAVDQAGALITELEQQQ